MIGDVIASERRERGNLKYHGTIRLPQALTYTASNAVMCKCRALAMT
jgi:hypothetical protein